MNAIEFVALHSRLNRVNELRIMKNYPFKLVSLFALSAFALSSCETRTGEGAAYGAAAGAIIGGAATGNVRAAAIGAAAGAATGAIIGRALDEEAARGYGPPPQGGYPFARPTRNPGFVRSPYPPNRLVDVRGIPSGALVRDPASGGIFRNP